MQNGPQVYLTHKEHKIIHKLRYKITNNIDNLYAYYMMSRDESSRRMLAKAAAKKSHIIFKSRELDRYTHRQSIAGKRAGHNAYINQKGIFAMSEEEKTHARNKGRERTVKQKLGMFSDQYKKQHKLFLQKRISTPRGIFDSMKAAANVFAVVPATITYRVNSKNFSDWSYI
jgi:hypothetical protein